MPTSQPSHAGKRPFLDVMAAHYAEQYAQLSGRSLSNAASFLISEGYQSAVEQMETKARHYIPPTESDDRRGVSYFLPQSMIDEIKKLAMADRKSASAVAADLIRAGLQARAAATAS
jgi:hypothetical protein